MQSESSFRKCGSDKRDCLAYSYRAKPKMWRAKWSQTFCANKAASSVPVCARTCQSVCDCVRSCMRLFSNVCPVLVCVYSSMCSYMPIQYMHEAMCHSSCFIGQWRCCCPPAFLTVMTTVWWLYCHISLLHMNGTTTRGLTNTAWQLESETAWWASVFAIDKIDHCILNTFNPPPSALMSQ